MKINLSKIVILQFWGWYYTKAVKGLINAWNNFIVFVGEYYSIPLLLRTIFHPWRRDITKYGRGFSIKNFLETLSFNFISRSIGFVIRFFTIIIGLICLLGVIILGFTALILWILLPLILAFFIITGITLLVG